MWHVSFLPNKYNKPRISLKHMYHFQLSGNKYIICVEFKMSATHTHTHIQSMLIQSRPGTHCNDTLIATSKVPINFELCGHRRTKPVSSFTFRTCTKEDADQPNFSNISSSMLRFYHSRISRHVVTVSVTGLTACLEPAKNMAFFCIPSLGPRKMYWSAIFEMVNSICASLANAIDVACLLTNSRKFIDIDKIKYEPMHCFVAHGISHFFFTGGQYSQIPC